MEVWNWGVGIRNWARKQEAGSRKQEAGRGKGWWQRTVGPRVDLRVLPVSPVLPCVDVELVLHEACMLLHTCQTAFSPQFPELQIPSS